MFYELLAEATIRSHISWAATSRVISSDSVLYKSTTYAHIHIHTYICTYAPAITIICDYVSRRTNKTIMKT